MQHITHNKKSKILHATCCVPHGHRGFSLIEIIIYISIFAMISIVVINSFVVVVNSFSNTKTTRDLLESGNTSLERISREIRQAKNIDIGNSTFASSPGVLQLNSTNAGGTTRIVKFAVVNGALNLYQDGALTGNLVGANISVTSLIFRRISTGTGEAVKIEVTFQDNRSKTLRSESFYDTVLLRGNY